MKIINNKEGFEEIFPYDKQYIKTYPKEYPCVVKVNDKQGEFDFLSFKRVEVAYFPIGLSKAENFIAGLESPWIVLFNG